MIFAIIMGIIIVFIITFTLLSPFVVADKQEKIGVITFIIEFVLWITVVAQIIILLWGINPQGG